MKNVNGIFGIFMHENCENAKMRKTMKVIGANVYLLFLNVHDLPKAF